MVGRDHGDFAIFLRSGAAASASFCRNESTVVDIDQAIVVDYPSSSAPASRAAVHRFSSRWRRLISPCART